MGQLFLFYALASVIALCSVLVVTLKNPVTSAVSLVMTLFFLAGIYAMQGAEFIAAIQVIVYTGAILVLFMFVIMLLNLDPHELGEKTSKSLSEWLVLFGIILGFLIFAVKSLFNHELTQLSKLPLVPDQDNTMEMGMLLFTKYLWPFELASVLILLAVVASVVIAKKKKEDTSANTNVTTSGPA